MIPEDLETLALADAIGALDADEQRDLHARLAALPPDVQSHVANLYDINVSIASAEQQVDPPPHVRTQLMARLSVPSHYTVTSDEGGWQPTSLPGITTKVLAIDRARGLVTMLVRGEAGAVYPSHHHTAPEECYVIRGTVRVEGRVLHAGDFHHADADSDHGDLVTPDGAEVLIVGGIADYLPDRD
jgi:quercetin dioxygenase-like cupin family protein